MIYTVKGPVNSILIDTDSNELRTIKTNEVLSISEEFNYNKYKSKHKFPYFECYDYRILDIFLISKDLNYEFIRKIRIKKSFFNIRIIINEYTKDSFIIIKELIKNLIDNSIFRGLIILSHSEKLNKQIVDHYDWVIVKKLTKDFQKLNNVQHYKPKFTTIPSIISLGKNHNLYYHSRLIYLLNNNELVKTNITHNNTAKSKIRTCLDCEYREVCYDKRDVLFNGKEYYYQDECSYDPYSGKWKP